LLGGNTVDKDGQNALPRVHVIIRDSAGNKAIDKKTGKVLDNKNALEGAFELKLRMILNTLNRYLKSMARDGTRRLVSVAHVVDVAQQLQFVAHGSNDGVQAVSDQSDLLLVIGIARQSIDSDIGELDEMLLDARSLLEEPAQIKSNSLELILKMNLL
jgi:hypothetical protein